MGTIFRCRGLDKSLDEEIKSLDLGNQQFPVNIFRLYYRLLSVWSVAWRTLNSCLCNGPSNGFGVGGAQTM